MKHSLIEILRVAMTVILGVSVVHSADFISQDNMEIANIPQY